MEHFHRMVKVVDPVKLERDAAQQLAALIATAPNAKVGETQFHVQRQGREIDFVIEALINNRRSRLVCEVKSDGRGQAARKAIDQLETVMGSAEAGDVSVFIAPYITEDVRELCRSWDINYFDLSGNCRLYLDGLFIEKSSGQKPPAERRELRSLFKPKSARVLRRLMRHPGRAMRLRDIAELTDVSIGQVFKVKEALLAHGWLDDDSNGVFLTRPDALLEAWRDEYETPEGEKAQLYTPLTGAALEEAIRVALRSEQHPVQAVLAGFSAADWLAPYVRSNTLQIYASTIGADYVIDALKATPSPKGANLVITTLVDEGPLLDPHSPALGIVTTSPVQTYLDLYASGDRGIEAAEHLRQERLQW